MILWVLLFLIVVAISFVLAFQSMKDYQEIPEKSKVDYGLYLIRTLENFDEKILEEIQKLIHPEGLIVSFERLFKGSKAALTVFGPKKVLDQFTNKLNLLELEDYTASVDSQDMAIWEVGKKKAVSDIFKGLPVLKEEEQFFWQVVLGGKKDKEQMLFQSQIRAAVYSKDQTRRKELAPLLQNIKAEGLIKVPRPFTVAQMLDFYRLRSLTRDKLSPVVKSSEVVQLLKV